MPSYAAKNSNGLSLRMTTMSSKTESHLALELDTAFLRRIKDNFFHVAFDIALIFIKRWESILEPTCIYIGLEPTLLRYH